ncbi:MAG TPA: serine hydrolase [Ktedonobacterales bacterium]|nr:serine hydrolase [Ktedonobacterales bacterium]
MESRDHDDDVAARCAARLTSLPGRTAFAARWMGSAGPSVMIRAEDALPAAGLLALPLAVETLRRADLGQFRLDERLPRPVDDAMDADGERSIGDLLALSLSGDDAAANALLDLVGRGEVNETAMRMGLRQTRLEGRFGDDTRAAYRENVSSASDMVTLLALARGNALPGASRLRAALSNARPVEAIALGLPADAEVARTTHVTRNSFSEAGILTGQGRACVYCFLGVEQADPQAAQAIFAIIPSDLWNG